LEALEKENMDKECAMGTTPQEKVGAVQARLEVALCFEDIWKKFEGRLVNINRRRS